MPKVYEKKKYDLCCVVPLNEGLDVGHRMDLTARQRVGSRHLRTMKISNGVHRYIIHILELDTESKQRATLYLRRLSG